MKLIQIDHNPSSRQLNVFGLIWLLLTVAFEVLFGRFVMGLSWERIASGYNVTNGGLMLRACWCCCSAR